MGFRDDTRLGTITYALFPFGIWRDNFPNFRLVGYVSSFPGGYIIYIYIYYICIYIYVYLKSDYTQITSQPAILSYLPNSPNISFSGLEMLRAGVKGWSWQFPEKKSFKTSTERNWHGQKSQKKMMAWNLEDDLYPFRFLLGGNFGLFFRAAFAVTLWGGLFANLKIARSDASTYEKPWVDPKPKWKFLRIPINVSPLLSFDCWPC